MRPKKKCDINKLTRKQLIVKCKGRGIAIGKLNAENNRLEAKLAIAPDVAELYASYMESLGGNHNLKLAIIAKDAIIESLTEDITNSDALLAQAQRQYEEAQALLSERAKQVVNLKDELSQLDKERAAAVAAAVKNNEHWRELAQFNALNTGQLINALKTMHTAAAHINDKYKEE